MAVVRGATQLGIKVEGLQELQAQFNKLGKMPKKHLTKASKAGSDGPLREAKGSAPTGETGLLKKGLQRKMETPNKRNKTVYRIRWNPNYTNNYLKPTTGAYGGKTPFAYYPHSVEYGFKGKYGRIETKHYHFVTKAIERTEAQSLKKIVNSLNDSIDQLTK
jgi:hypothetical protein